jgi:hypothetical protein
MKVNNHVGKLFLADQSLRQRVIANHLLAYTDLITPETDPQKELDNFLLGDSERYIVSANVMKSLSFLKLKKPYNYGIFKKHIDGSTKTYLLPDNEILRIKRVGDTLKVGIFFFKGEVYDGKDFNWLGFKWNLWRANLDTGLSIMGEYDKLRALGGEEVILDQFDDNIEYFEHKVFALLCFIFLSEVEVREVQPNSRYGTQKSGKILNNTDMKFILINSDWNVTYIRSEGFDVSGHLALRHVGVGRGDTRVVFIAPYRKNGYKREAEREKH